MPRISAAMIVKNAADSIGAAVASLRGVVDEVVVLDTGSTDGTPECAAAVGEAWGADGPPVRVEHWPWRDDFSAARNEVAARCQGEWLVVLDADEVLEPGDLRQTILACPEGVDGVSALVICQGVAGQPERFVVARAYRKSIGHWQYPAHNQLAGLRRVARSTAVVRSDYAGAGGVPARLRRTAPILMRYYADHPRDMHAPLHLGRMYAAVRSWPGARAWAEIALRLADRQPAEVLAWAVLVDAALATEGPDAASRMLQRAIDRLPRAPDLYHLAMTLAAARWVDASGAARDTEWEVSSCRTPLHDEAALDRAQAAFATLGLGITILKAAKT